MERAKSPRYYFDLRKERKSAAKVAQIIGAGSCTITAQQPGDATTWQAAPDVLQTFSITKATPTVAVSFAASPIIYDGDPHPATAVATGVNNTVLGSTDGTTTISYTKSGNPFAGPPTEADSYTASAHFASNNGNYTDADFHRGRFVDHQCAAGDLDHEPEQQDLRRCRSQPADYG